MLCRLPVHPRPVATSEHGVGRVGGVGCVCDPDAVPHTISVATLRCQLTATLYPILRRFSGVLGATTSCPPGISRLLSPRPDAARHGLGLPRPASLFPSCRHRQLYCLVGKVVLTSSLEVRVLSWLPSLQQGSGRTFSHISGCPAGVAVSSGYLLVICCVAEVSFDVDVMIDRL